MIKKKTVEYLTKEELKKEVEATRIANKYLSRELENFTKKENQGRQGKGRLRYV